MFHETYDKLVKISMVGDTCVGKTSLTRRLINNDFADSYNATVCMDFDSTTIENEGILIKIQMWDTSGQERFRNIAPLYLRTCDVTLLCFAYNDKESFKSIEMWIKHLHDNDVHTRMILVGTKGDLPGFIRDNEAQECAARHNIPYIRTSSRLGLGRDEILDNILLYTRDPPLTHTESPIFMRSRYLCCVIL